jgi:ceramide glucosyltransferase
MLWTALLTLRICEWVLMLPVVGGTLYSFACLAAMARLKVLARRAAPAPAAPAAPAAWSCTRAPLAFPTPAASAAPPAGAAFASPGGHWPPVSVLRPIYGLTKNLRENLETVCRLDYPEYQVVLSAQREDEPALPLLRDFARRFGPERVTVVVDPTPTVPNGKARNLLVGFSAARHEVLVVSDSDVPLRPDYLKTIVAPLADPEVGCVSTFYKATGAGRWYERLEQLFINADWVPNLVFAHVTGVSPFVLGASNAVRRDMLEAVGGWGELGWYVLEDFEMGRRIRARGKRSAVVPYFVDTLVDLRSFRDWFRHQLYWDRNTRAGNAWGLFGTLFVRAIPFALAFAAARGCDTLGLAVAAGAVTLRLATAGIFMGWGLGDWQGVQSLVLLPLRDLAGFVSTLTALVRPAVRATGQRFAVGRDGRMVAPAAKESKERAA